MVLYFRPNLTGLLQPLKCISHLHITDSACDCCADDGVLEFDAGRSDECPEQGPVFVMTKQPQHEHCIMYPDFTFWDWEGTLMASTYIFAWQLAHPTHILVAVSHHV